MTEMPTDDAPVKVIEGDCLDVLRALPDGCVDAVITDPPYSSGGMFRGDRVGGADEKYTRSEYQGKRPDFGGDCCDQRAWSQWCYWWLTECRRVVKVGGYLISFCDWRQYPTLTDAVMWSGWFWRGVVVWDKTPASRAPRRGYFKHQCEFAAWATNGPLCPPEESAFGHLSGCFTLPTSQSDKHHITGKPTKLMRELVKVCPPGGLILDPFAGSGTTGKAALLEGRRCILIEKEPAYAAICRRRVAEAMGGPLLVGG